MEAFVASCCVSVAHSGRSVCVCVLATFTRTEHSDNTRDRIDFARGADPPKTLDVGLDEGHTFRS